MRVIERAQQLIHPLKQRVESVTRQTPAVPSLASVYLMEERNPLLDEAAKQRIRAYDQHMRQKMEEDRVKMESVKVPTHVEVNGKMVTLLESWNIYVAEQLRLEREAIARGEVYIPPMSAFGTGKAAEPVTR